MSDQAREVQRWSVVDLAFAGGPVERPFEVDLEGTFTGPGGESLAVPGFYDGDDRWVIRFAPAVEGEWTYAIRSGLTALDGKTGSVTCVANRRKEVHGKLMVDPDNPRHFRYEDGTPYFLIGFEIDWLFALDLGNAEDIPKTRRIVDAMADGGFNHAIMNVYAHQATWPSEGRDTGHCYGNPALFVFGGTNDAPDHSVLNVEFFRRFDRVVKYLEQKEVVAHIMIYVWNKEVKWAEKGSPEDDRYLDYVVARYQAFSNVVWDVSKEALAYDCCGEDYVTMRSRRIRQRDAYRRLVTVHDGGYCESHSDEIDFYSIQTWDWGLYAVMKKVRDEHPNMPVLNIEHGGYERGPYLTFPGSYQDPEICLSRNYACLFAGTYSTYYWQCSSWDIVIDDIKALPAEQRPRFEYFRYMQDFFSRAGFASLEPCGGSSVGLGLRREGEVYLYFKPRGAYAVHCGQQIEAQDLVASWFNPLTGEESEPKTVKSGKWKEYKSPWGEEMGVLKLMVKESG